MRTTRAAVNQTRSMYKFAGVISAVTMTVLIPASGAFADTTQPNACVGQRLHTMAIPDSGNVEAHADFHGVTVQQLLQHIQTECGK